MSEEQESERENDNNTPPDMFPVVWVKMEVDEDGVVDGIDDPVDQESTDQESQDHTYKGSDSSIPQEPQRKRKRRKVQPQDQHLKCDHCEYKTAYPSALKFHILKHTNPEPLSCDQCEYTTRYPCSLRRHVLGQHDMKNKETVDVPTFKCRQCDYTTIFKGNLAAHQRKHATEKTYKCDQCDFSSAYRHSYLKHSKTHMVKDSSTIYQCDQCSFTTRFEGHIARHLAQIHKIISNKAHQCDQCTFSTTIRWRLSIHKNRSRQETPIKCKYCDFVTQYNCGFKLHKVKHLGRKSRVVETDIYMPNEDFVPDVEESEKTVKHLGRKSRVVETDIYMPNKDFVPDVEESEKTVKHLGRKSRVVETDIYMPNEDFVPDVEESEKTEEYVNNTSVEDESNMKPSVSKKNKAFVPAMIGNTEYLVDTESEAVDWRAIEVKEIPGHEKPFQCISCSYKSRFKASVQRHYQRHHTGQHSRPYKCMHCDFRTKTRDQIALHNKRSKSDVPLNCKFCEFTTYLKCQNVMHQKVHYPYKCKLCTYTCRANNDIQRHYSSVHLGNGLKCQYCDYTAVRKDSLTCHEAIHTGVKPFQCKFCDYSTVRGCVLDNHVRKIHPDRYSVTIIDYSKIQSLKIEKNVSEETDIVETNPLFQSAMRSEVERNMIEGLSQIIAMKCQQGEYGSTSGQSEF